MPASAMRWLAGVAFASGVAAESSRPLNVMSFSVYPGYSGALQVNGTVRIGQEGNDTQVLFYDLTGTDPQCGTANITGVANACGVHVHAGTACDAAGGHYYSSSLNSDPWATVSYTTVGGAATGQDVRVTTGLRLPEVAGRTFVVHDVTGARVACAVLDRGVFVVGSARRVAAFARYPGYEGNLAVSGTMDIQQVGAGAKASQVLTYELSGTDPKCGKANITGVANACGIHVHQGSDCSDAATIGGHYYDKATYSVDPWKPIRYATAGGRATGTTIEVVTGTTAANITGRAMVVHDSTGARIACGTIEMTDLTLSSSAAPVARLSAALAAALLALRLAP